jgi:hypothetical protein
VKRVYDSERGVLAKLRRIPSTVETV